MANHRVTNGGLRGPSTRAAASSCANYIGRVGALAVALGIGVAVITSPDIAWADDGTTSNVDKDVTKDTVNEAPNNPSNDTPDEHQAPESHVVNPVPDQGTSTSTSAGTGSGTGSGTSIGVAGGPEVTLNAQTVTTNDTTTNAPTHTTLTPTPPVIPPPTAPPTVDPPIVGPTGTVDDGNELQVLKPGAFGTTLIKSDSSKSRVLPSPHPPTGPPAGVDDDQPPTMRMLNVQTVASTSTSNVLQANIFNTPDIAARPVPTVPPPTLFETLIALPGTFIPTALNLITQALAPLTGPGAPADNPVLWAVLAFVRRQFNQSFANSTPVLAPRQTSQDLDDDQVHGTFGGTDADGDTLAYTVPTTGLGAPVHGTVAIDEPTGTYTYTPAAGYVGEDYFFVTVTDDTAAPHIHALGQTHLAAARIDVNVLPHDDAPEVGTGPTVGTVDPASGAVTGFLGFSDPDGDPLTYTLVDGPANGSVTFNQQAGTYTYVPTQAARINAGLAAEPVAVARFARTALAAAPDPATDSFTVAASDGRASTTAGVTVPVAPATFTVTNTLFRVGGDTLGVAISRDGTRVYVTNYASKSVSVLDGATGAVIGAPIVVGTNPRGIVLSPDGSRAYVTNYSSSTVSVINTATNTVIGTPIPVGISPSGLAVSPDGTRIYVANNATSAGTVSVINTATNTVIGTPIPVGTNPGGVAVSPDGTRVYVTNQGSNNVSVINTATNTVIGAPIAVGFLPTGVAVTPDGNRVYVTNENSGTVSVIDTATNSVIGPPISGVLEPEDVAISPDGSLAYVADASNYTVTVIDTRTGTMIGQPIAVAPGSRSLEVSADGRHVYVVGLDSLSIISVFPVATNRAPSASPTVTNPDFVSGAVTVALHATDPDGDTLTYAVNAGPARGTLTPTGAGNFTYTPNDTARTQAEGTPGPDSDTFTVSVTDSKGATTLVPVSVSVAPALIVNHTLTLPGQYQWSTVSPDKGRMTVSTYDTNPTSGAATTRVAVIDTATGLQIGHTVVIAGGAMYAYPLVSPDGRRAIFTTTANAAAGANPTTLVTVVDTTTGEQVGSSVTVAGAAGITKALNADATRIAVTATTTSGTPATSVSIIDATTGKQVGTSVVVVGTVDQNTLNGIAIDTGDARTELAVTPDGRRVVVTANDDTDYSPTTPVTSRLIVIDATTGAQIGATVTLRGTAAAALTPDGRRAVVTAQHYDNQGGTILNDASQFAVVDTATGAQLGHTVDVDGFAVATLTDDGTRVVSVSSTYPSSTFRVAVYDSATSIQVGTTFTGSSTSGTTAVYGNRVVVTNPGTGATQGISVIDTTTGTQIGTTTQTSGITYLYGIRQVDDHNRLLDIRYTSNTAAGATGNTYVSAIDLSTGNLLTQTVVAGQLYASAVNGNRVVIATKSADPTDPSAITRVAVFVADSGAQVGTTVVVSGARGYGGNTLITLTPDGKRAWIMTDTASSSTSSVALVDLPSGLKIGSTTTIPGTDIYSNTRVFSPDGSRLTLATDDNGTQLVSVFDTATGALVGAPIRVTGDFYANATFRADGKRVIVSVQSPNATNDVDTTDTVIDTSTGTVVGQPFSFPGTDVYSVDGIAPGSNAIEFGAYGPSSDQTSVTLVNTDAGAPLGSTVTFPGYPMLSQYRNGDTFGTVLGVAVNYASDTTTINITHVVLAPDAATTPVIGTPTTVGTPDPTTGASTFTVNVAANPNGSPQTFSATQPTGVHGSITTSTPVHNADGTYNYAVTYTPDPQDRVNAYSTPEPDEVHLTVAVVNGAGLVATRDVPVTVEPIASAVIGSGTLVQAPAGSITTGPDGTLVQSVRTGAGTAADPYKTTYTVLRLGQPATSTTITGQAAGYSYFGVDGVVAEVTQTGRGTAADPIRGTVTVFRPGQPATSSTVTGYEIGVTGGVDGTIAQTTQTGGGSTTDPFRTTVTVLRPGQPATSTTIVGSSYSRDYFDGGAQIGADGTVAQTTYTYTAAGNGVMTVTVLRPGQPAVTSSVPGDPYLVRGVAHVGADGTVVQNGIIGDGSGADPIRTTVTVLRSGQPPVTSTVLGFSNYKVAQIGADGTIAQSTQTGTGTAADPYQTNVLVLRPGQPEATTTIIGKADDEVHIGANGTVAQRTYTGTDTAADPVKWKVTVLRPGQPATSATMTGNPFFGIPIGADGTVIQTTYTGTFTAADPVKTTVSVLRPGQLATSTTVAGLSFGVVGTDGTVVLTSRSDGAGTLADPTTVTVLKRGVPATSNVIIGRASGPAEIRDDGTVALTTEIGDGSSADPYRTAVTVLRAGAILATVTTAGRPMGAAAFTASNDLILVTMAGDGSAADPAVYTTTKISVARV
jgi:YVTN family beta-propeller protein